MSLQGIAAQEGGERAGDGQDDVQHQDGLDSE